MSIFFKKFAGRNSVKNLLSWSIADCYLAICRIARGEHSNRNIWQMQIKYGIAYNRLDQKYGGHETVSKHRGDVFNISFNLQDILVGTGLSPACDCRFYCRKCSLIHLILNMSSRRNTEAMSCVFPIWRMDNEKTTPVPPFDLIQIQKTLFNSELDCMINLDNLNRVGSTHKTSWKKYKWRQHLNLNRSG